MKTRFDEMRGLQWYARNPEHALHGMRNMTPEQRGIYNTILDRIYLTGDRLEDNDLREAAHNNCHIRVYRRVKAELIAMGKLSLEAVDNTVHIRNEAATKEVVRGRLLADQAAVNGSIGGRVSATTKGQKASKNNGSTPRVPQATAQATAQHTYQEDRNKSSDRPILASPREGSAAQPKGRASPCADALASHPESAVRALATTFVEGDAEAWVSYGATIERIGKSFVVQAPSPARAGLIQARFGAKLRASLKNYTLKAPTMPDISIP
jgi:uncharacterized protein YdaU (DUF1376 family)